MKTIKQIADEIGVTKQAVFYRIKRPPLSNALQHLISKNEGVLMVDIYGEALIKQAFSESDRQTHDDKQQTFVDKEPSKENTLFDGEETNNTSDINEPAEESPFFDGEIVKLLQDNIALLQEQLRIKDEQLAASQEALKATQESLKAEQENLRAEQLLHADTKKMLMLPDGQSGSASTEPVAQPSDSIGTRIKKFFTRR